MNHDFLRSFRFLSQSPGILLHQSPGNHDLVSAAHAFQTEIRAHAEDFPFIAAAWMGLF